MDKLDELYNGLLGTANCVCSPGYYTYSYEGVY